MDYKNTINLLGTTFQMRGNLAKREPEMLVKWNRQQRYQKLRNLCNGRPKFILHDGPPYANGQLHIGHASNKILKDIILRSKTLAGFDTPYVPGWDCHGLPIELNIEKQFGKNLPPREFRNKCREYANLQIEAQKADFMRLGILANWQNPYKTMDFKTEAGILQALGRIYQNGYIFQGVKPVHWCLDCKSALAEAEVEYQDRESHAIDVAFQALDAKTLAQEVFLISIPDAKNISAIIWTTTPWTLVANQAICVGPEVEYALVAIENQYLIIAKNLVKEAISRYPSIHDYKIIASATGKKLEMQKFKHPFYERVVPLIVGEHATDDAGTGLVHTAPAHGMDDYLVANKYNLEINNPVDDNGRYVKSTEIFAGMNVFKANAKIIEILKQQQCLMAEEVITHSYPCCWRHKSKIIFRTTPQWFISMDKPTNDGESLRSKAHKAVSATKFFPSWGRERLASMIDNRPDWCISRQRNWCVPMPFFIHKETNILHPDSNKLLEEIAKLVEVDGIDAWFDLKPEQILSPDDCNDYVKLNDTLDVWFDSGVTHLTVLEEREELMWPADLYLEGSDQHRGWFQSSLLTSCAIKDRAPYKQLLTHGFLVDGDGYKMSKSKGNIVSIPDAVKKYGADIIRLWVASTDYSGDIAFSEDIMQQVTESYRRVRNTVRFFLANLTDFDVNKHAVEIDDLVQVDKYSIAYLTELQNKVVNKHYVNYQFHFIVQELLKYCSEELGGFYLEILKDRLYTAKAESHARRSAQTTLFHITGTLLQMLSPILAFTSDEAWEILVMNDEDSILYHKHNLLPRINEGEKLIKKWEKIKNFRGLVLKELENKRTEGVIGSSLQAELVINAPTELFKLLDEVEQDLKFAYMVSKITLNCSDKLSVVVTKSINPKCERCWHYTNTVGMNKDHPSICIRCVENIFGAGEVRTFA